MENLAELKKSVEALAAEESKSAIAIITELQAAAAQTGNDELLDNQKRIHLVLYTYS